MTARDDAESRTQAPRRSPSRAAARLRAAAVEVFARHGYGATTTRQIASELGMSPAAMYPHYRSKEELLFAISVDGHEDALAHLRAHDHAEASASERLRTVIGAFAEWQARNHAHAKVVQYELSALSAEHYDEVNELRRATTRVVRDIVDAGVASGEFTVPDPQGVTLALMSLCVDISRWYPSGRYRTPASISALYSDLALRLVGASPVADG